MITHNIQFHDKMRKKSLNICFLELLEEFRRNSKTSSNLTMVNETSMFELSRFDSMEISRKVHSYRTIMFRVEPRYPEDTFHMALISYKMIRVKQKCVLEHMRNVQNQAPITKTCLFKYIEIFTSKQLKTFR